MIRNYFDPPQQSGQPDGHGERIRQPLTPAATAGLSVRAGLVLPTRTQLAGRGQVHWQSAAT